LAPSNVVLHSYKQFFMSMMLTFHREKQS